MGIIYDLLTGGDSLSIATEADDITDDVANQADDISNGDSSDNTGDINTDTNDILGTKDDNSSGNDTSDDTAGDDPEAVDDGADSSDLNGDDFNDDMGDVPDDDSSDESDPLGGDSPDDQSDENDPFMESRKRKIKKQFMHLYNVIDNSVKLLSAHTPNTTDVKYIQTIGAISDNLLQCKEIIYNLAVSDFQTAEYHELLKKYVSINRIYELSTKSLEKYMTEYRKQHGDGKSKDSTDA